MNFSGLFFSFKFSVNLRSEQTSVINSLLLSSDRNLSNFENRRLFSSNLCRSVNWCNWSNLRQANVMSLVFINIESQFLILSGVNFFLIFYPSKRLCYLPSCGIEVLIESERASQQIYAVTDNVWRC
jgi:hypothetical protein